MKSRIDPSCDHVENPSGAGSKVRRLALNISWALRPIVQIPDSAIIAGGFFKVLYPYIFLIIYHKCANLYVVFSTLLISTNVMNKYMKVNRLIKIGVFRHK